MNSTIWNGFQNIGDDLILMAEETAFKAHFSKKRSVFSYIAIAASILFIFSLSARFIYNPKSKNLDHGMFPETVEGNLVESHGRHIIEKETKDYIYILSFEKDSYKIDEEIIFKLSCTAKYNSLSSQDISIKFSAKDYDMVIDGEKKNILSASSANGKISFDIDVSLIPKNPSKIYKVKLDILLYADDILDGEGENYEHESNNSIENVSFSIPISILED